MTASMKVDVSGLKRLAEKFSSSALRREMEVIAQDKGVAALLGQAVADNFNQNGPGWPAARIPSGRRLLRRSGQLFASATTPGAPGNIYRVDGTVVTWGTNLIYASIHNKGGTITVKNAKALFIPLTAKAERQGPQRDKSKRDPTLKLGKDFVFKQSVTIPARPFMVLRDFWKQQLIDYFVQRAKAALKKGLR